MTNRCIVGFLADRPDWEHRLVHAWGHPDEPDQRFLHPHGFAEGTVVGGLRVDALPLVSRIPVLAQIVLVWSLLGSLAEGREDGKRRLAGQEADPAHVLMKRNHYAAEFEGADVPSGDDST